LNAARQAKQEEVHNIEKQWKEYFGKHQKAQDSLNQNEELLQSLLTGLGAGGTGGGYLGQLADAQQRLAQAKAEEEQNNVKLGMAKKELKTLEARWKEVEREAGEGRGNLEKKRRDVEQLRQRIEKTGWNTEKEQKLENDLRDARATLRSAAEVCLLLSSTTCSRIPD
jgi:structural maintenance of chromosome 2